MRSHPHNLHINSVKVKVAGTIIPIFQMRKTEAQNRVHRNARRAVVEPGLYTRWPDLVLFDFLSARPKMPT